MKKQLIAALALTVSTALGAGMASATTLTYEDNWVNWPGYTSPIAGDEWGTPRLIIWMLHIMISATILNQ
ncbi:hypothetical protein DGMP_33200 [Desulfomarina profundi]|uniref:Uncharacterized protein n=1 Tax=Desulfomarina profundi TaxID=2772557 RepID=A0A8D5FZ68_9BACT|nr:hypothetical protein [Desulfomarina profundi]BCL62627.1 hypothetical protein DGMP_33200 [Desulfomarina profundi]